MLTAEEMREAAAKVCVTRLPAHVKTEAQVKNAMQAILQTRSVQSPSPPSGVKDAEMDLKDEVRLHGNLFGMIAAMLLGWRCCVVRDYSREVDRIGCINLPNTPSASGKESERWRSSERSLL